MDCQRHCYTVLPPSLDHAGGGSLYAVSFIPACHDMACHCLPWHALACHGVRWHTNECHGMPWHEIPMIRLSLLSCTTQWRNVRQSGQSSWLWIVRYYSHSVSAEIAMDIISVIWINISNLQIPSSRFHKIPSAAVTVG